MITFKSIKQPQGNMPLANHIISIAPLRTWRSRTFGSPGASQKFPYRSRPTTRGLPDSGAAANMSLLRSATRRAIKHRSLFIKVDPIPETLAERRAVLHALKQFGKIEVFKKKHVCSLPFVSAPDCHGLSRMQLTETSILQHSKGLPLSASLGAPPLPMP